MYTNPLKTIVYSKDKMDFEQVPTTSIVYEAFWNFLIR